MSLQGSMDVDKPVDRRPSDRVRVQVKQAGQDEPLCNNAVPTSSLLMGGVRIIHSQPPEGGFCGCPQPTGHRAFLGPSCGPPVVRQAHGIDVGDESVPQISATADGEQKKPPVRAIHGPTDKRQTTWQWRQGGHFGHGHAISLGGRGRVGWLVGSRAHRARAWASRHPRQVYVADS